jgi:hypothetical protein
MSFSKERLLMGKGVLRKAHALRCNEIAPSFGVCDGCISRRRCQVGVRKIWKNTDRAPKRGRASFGTQSAERGLNHLAASGGDFTRKALTSKGIRLAAYRLLRRLHDRR